MQWTAKPQTFMEKENTGKSELPWPPHIAAHTSCSLWQLIRVPHLQYGQNLPYDADLWAQYRFGYALPGSCPSAFLLRLITVSPELPQASLSLTTFAINLERTLALQLWERIPLKGESEGSIRCSKKKQNEKKPILSHSNHTWLDPSSTFTCQSLFSHQFLGRSVFWTLLSQ